mgnify:CR=1 FL=1
MVLHIKSDQGHETGFAEMEFSRDMCRCEDSQNLLT